jgi:hypothetical protein
MPPGKYDKGKHTHQPGREKERTKKAGSSSVGDSRAFFTLLFFIAIISVIVSACDVHSNSTYAMRERNASVCHY